MKIGKYILTNDEKADRAIFGTMGRGGQKVGGVGEAASDEAKLAEYDRLGGLVRLGVDNVKKGCFWDFAKKTAFAEPKVFLVFKINGKDVEVSADEPLPPLVRAAKAAGEEEKDIEEEERPRKRGGKKASTGTEIDEG